MTREGINPRLLTDDGKKLNVMENNRITPPIDLYFIQVIGLPTELSSVTAIDDTSITVDSVADISVGNLIGIFSGVSAEERFYFGEVLSLPGGNVVELDTPLDFAFDAGDPVISSTRDLNVNGDITPQVFTVSAGGVTSTIDVDITRIIVSMTLATAPDDGLFGDLAQLIKGIVLRRVDGETRNIWNVKSNGDFASLSYDVTYTTRTVPLGSFGVRCRYTFAGQDKHGVAVNLVSGDSLELIVQDDLTGITSLRVLAAGHIRGN